MIVYHNTKSGFQYDVRDGKIDLVVEEAFRNKLQRKLPTKERESIWNSLEFMSNILQDDAIPNNAGVAVECQIPNTSKRIDFIITGRDDNNRDNVVIVELKQWKTAEITQKDGIVRTALGKGLRETNHPSYQAWSYAALLEDFNETVQDDNIGLAPCAYLHNYDEDDVIRNVFYQNYLEKAPVFLKRDREKLREFIKRYIKTGDEGESLYRIDKGKIRPSKQLSESLSNLLKGNQEFILVDEQKIVFETALSLTKQAQTMGKKVLIVEGGPGTGKSVIAINLLVEITRRELLVQYISRNQAPRDVYQSKLTGQMTKTRFSNMFQGSGSFTESPSNEFDALVVDEAHRLNLKSGMFQNKGENQIKEIINAAKCSIFLIDENQKIAMRDIGTKEEIIRHAKNAKAEIIQLELESQFRCNGSDAYLAFLDNLLQVRETPHNDLTDIDYEFIVCNSPIELQETIYKKNIERNSARMVAGYCWDWISANDKTAFDITFPQFGFQAQWNLREYGMLWIINPNSVKEVGCVHTAQGLEIDHVGVIVGPDLIVRDGEIITIPDKRSKMDSTIKGFKKLKKTNPQEAEQKAEQIIKNTYRTLMTRGAKSCSVWSVDPETNEWFKKHSTRKSPLY
jgi:DUF2075 family protein